MINIHHPSILALLDTRMAGHKNLSEELGFPNQIQSSATDSFGGIVTM